MTLKNNKVVVVGAGLMGTGIAHAFASSGFSTALVDSDENALERAHKGIGKILDDGVRLGKFQVTAADAAKARLT
ncbi:3-hydroxyacyl-CoA dehydrogenase NAD-binding domain-containing protein, partial [Escherichia coli]|nr:3-hydroxyacyl-CoA dehydrogenase NAD-binding domain-containing protein [Escherichia coli]